MFLGKPGGGKSYGALLDALEEATRGDRVIVTNLSIDPGKLSAFVQRHHPDAEFDPNQRLVVLTQEQARRFWLYRGPAVLVPDVTKEQEKLGQFPDFAKYAGNGCLFIIDEAHVLFDARAWAESGLSLTYYNSQHRKLNDEVIFVTQFLELIDKRCRGFAQSFHYFRNGAAEMLFTFFRAPSYFLVKVYQRPPTGMMDTPSEVHRYTLNKELADCYDTSAGVGISGRKKPEEKKKRGLHFAWVVVPMVALLCAMWFGPDLLARLAFGSGRSARSEGAGSLLRRPNEHAAERERERIEQSASPEPDRNRVSELWVVGYVVRGTRVNVLLSDGRTLTENDRELELLERNGAHVDGKKLFLVPTSGRSGGHRGGLK